MFRLRLTTALLLASGLAVAAPAEDKTIPDREVVAWVHQRVRDWQPTAEDRRFDEIGWAADLREAQRLARQHDRPVFLFTHDGHMAVGRC